MKERERERENWLRLLRLPFFCVPRDRIHDTRSSCCPREASGQPVTRTLEQRCRQERVAEREGEMEMRGGRNGEINFPPSFPPRRRCMSAYEQQCKLAAGDLLLCLSRLLLFFASLFLIPLPPSLSVPPPSPFMIASRCEGQRGSADARSSGEQRRALGVFVYKRLRKRCLQARETESLARKLVSLRCRSLARLTRKHMHARTHAACECVHMNLHTR